MLVDNHDWANFSYIYDLVQGLAVVVGYANADGLIYFCFLSISIENTSLDFLIMADLTRMGRNILPQIMKLFPDNFRNVLVFPYKTSLENL